MKAALYIRVSTHHQVDKDSLPFQRSELINYAKYVLGIDDYELFEDAGYSGKNTDRPAFQNMMNKIKNREFTHLLVWKIDRISRNLLDFCAMYDEIKEYGVIFVSKNEQFDTSSAMGEAMLKIILVFAELERKLTAERVSSIMLSRAEKGLWNGANVPLGYVYDKVTKFPKIDSKESKTIKLIFDTYEEIKSATHVMKHLNDNNIPTKRGGRWTSKTVTDIIRNPFYKGTYRYNYRESARGSKKDEKEWIIIDDNHEGIISKEQWQLCNDIMDKNAERNSSMYRKDVNTHVFSSILKCENCGRGFIANTDQPRKNGWRPSTYRCQGRARFYDCDAGMTGDVKIGSFVINYLSNFIKAINSINKKSTVEDLENQLLKGKEFKYVHINKDDLDYSFKLISSINVSNVINSNKNVKVNKVSSNNLNSERDKYKRALNRLEDLYLFDDEGMSEKDYLVKKQKLENKLSEINKELEEKNNSNSTIDWSFLNNTLLKNELLNKDHIDYKNLDMTIDRDIIKKFINDIVEKITIKKDGRVASISFKNGITHNFTYTQG
ncbi:recombinase family protein [Romboutsia sp. 1001713B170207_170306_H8]|uniref:recombinase family protein n=1 Tax=Romboutsia sp. 1001713B170207_170306_H8 TaxID=2787112 RepID=UPI00189BD721|nr:recombinase family protein [Romboutsia sp. 1001713B170207_170306_H8]